MWEIPLNGCCSGGRGNADSCLAIFQDGRCLCAGVIEMLTAFPTHSSTVTLAKNVNAFYSIDLMMGHQDE